MLCGSGPACVLAACFRNNVRDAIWPLLCQLSAMTEQNFITRTRTARTEHADWLVYVCMYVCIHNNVFQCRSLWRPLTPTPAPRLPACPVYRYTHTHTHTRHPTPPLSFSLSLSLSLARPLSPSLSQATQSSSMESLESSMSTSETTAGTKFTAPN